MTSYSFFKMAAVSYIELFKGYCRPPTKCKWGPRSILKFRLDRIYSFGDNAIIVLWGFGLNLPIYMIVSAAHAQNEGLVYFRGTNWPHILVCGVDLPIHHPTCKGVACRWRDVYWRSPMYMYMYPVLSRNFLSLRKSTKNLRFLAKMGSKCKNLFSGPPKGTSFDVLIVKIGAAA